MLVYMMLLLLLLTFVLLQSNCTATYAPGVLMTPNAVNAAADELTATPAVSTTQAAPLMPDAIAIRHERSRARHSNERDHIVRTDARDHEYKNGTISSVKSEQFNSNSLMISRREHLRWQLTNMNTTLNNKKIPYHESTNAQPTTTGATSKAIETPTPVPAAAALIFEPNKRPTPTAMPYAQTTLAAVTHKIRKLHKKKIMESIRNTVGKSLGFHLSKNHRSLVRAEQLQGRPTDDVSDSIIGSELDEVMQLADELDLADTMLQARGMNVYNLNDKTNDNNVVDSDDHDDNGVDDKSAAAYAHGHAVAETDKDNEDDEDYQNDELYTTKPTKILKLRPVAGLGGILKQSLKLKPTIDKQQMQKHSIIFDDDEDADDDASDAGVALIKSDSIKTTTVKTSYNNNDKLEIIKNDVTNATTISTTTTRNQRTTLNAITSKLQANDSKANAEESVSAEDNRNDTIFFIESNNNVLNYDYLTESPQPDTTIETELPETNSLGPKQSASTSHGGLGVERQLAVALEEINFDDNTFDNSEGTMDDGLIENRNLNEFSVPDKDGSTSSGNEMDDSYDTNPFLAGAVDAANEDEIYDWDEISRSNRRNLMRGRDVVTKFLQIVETQHSLGSNCEAGTSLNLGEGVVDRYAQDRFRVEAEVAVNRANMLTRIFKMTGRHVQEDVNLLHASVLSMVEFDDDIFAAGNCFDWNEHPAQPGLFCPFAYRLPPPNLGAILAKDLATEYHYLGNTSEWFFQARKNAEKVIARNEQYLKAFHLYSNKTDERIEDETLAVKYEDGRWSKPYYDCGGGNIWMLTYTVPFFGYENDTYHFKGTSGIDIDLRRVDIDQCPQRSTPGTVQPLNIFAGTDKCKQRTTMCDAIKGLGFRRGSYKCLCRKGYYFPDTTVVQKFFNGSLLEEEYEKLMLGKNSTYNTINEYECLPCAEGCDSCEDSSPCIAALNWPMRTSILVLACIVIGLLPPAAWFTFRYQQVKVVRAASPALLRVIALGAFFIYCTNIVMYPNPNLYTCTARIWLREIGFSLTYGALMLKTWRISVIFRVRSAKAIKITDAALLKRLGVICGGIGTCLLVRTLVSPPDVVVGRTADDLKAFLCKTDWWDYSFTSMEVLFLAWGVRLCIMVRKAPSEFNESRFISMAIYNEFLLTCFLNVSMLFLQSPANPDLLYIIFFCHTQLTVTLLLGLIFGSKVYIVLRSGKSHHEAIGLGAKASGAKFNFRPQVRTFANPSSVTTSTAPAPGTTSGENKLSDQEALEEIRQLSVQLQRIQDMAPPKGVAVMTITSLLDGLKTPGGMMMVAAAATQAATAAGNQLTIKQQSQTQGALPLLAISNDMQSYNQQSKIPQNTNIGNGKATKTVAIAETNQTHAVQFKAGATKTAPTPTTTKEKETLPTGHGAFVEKSINTELSGDNFLPKYDDAKAAHIICSRCYEISKEHYSTCLQRSSPPITACERLGSPQTEGSLNFANIKLECMCSQPDDLDRTYIAPPRRANMRTAATNTPPSSGTCRRRNKTTKTQPTAGSSASLQETSESISYRICDKCKNKYSSSRLSKKRASKTKSSSHVNYKQIQKQQQPHQTSECTPSGLTQTQSNDLLERSLEVQPDNDQRRDSKKATHSTEDMTFYSSSSDSEDRSGHACAEKADEQNIHLRLTQVGTSLTLTTLFRDLPEGADNDEQPTAMSPTTTDTAPPIILTAETAQGNDPTNFSQSNAATDSSTTIAGASGTVNDSSNDNSNGRPKRPDKLMLDLNDRSKYTKEVSV